MIRFWLFFLVVIILLSSCVSNRKYVYLQKGDLGINAQKNTVVRNYAIDSFVYKVQPNDILSVKVKSLTDKEFDFFADYGGSNQSGNLSNSASALLIGELVDDEGNIPLPVLGSVKVGGLSVLEIQDTLQRIATRYFESPVVKVRLLNYRITILGEVNKEGSVTLGNNRVSLLEAVGLAGGLGELADRANVKLIRQNGNEAEVIYLNLLDETLVNSPYYYVYQNDVLIVPPLKQRPFRKYFGQNVALFVSSVSILLLAFNLTK